jgi:hypothetical protein
MPDDSYRTIQMLLSSSNPDELNKGLDLAAIEIARVGSNEATPLFEMVMTLFYIDAFDHPELVPIVDKAINMAVGFGTWVIPVLMNNLDSGDIKAQWAVANVLGRIGADAINPMLMEYASASNDTLRAFMIYALGKVKSPKIVQAAAIVLDAARSSNLELRDTATRALGKIVESIPSGNLTKEQKQQFIECLRNNLSDPNAGVRAKAIRSLGKMAKFGHMADAERKQLKDICRFIAGIDEEGDWDRAFIVRKEAEEALKYVQ